MKNVMEIDGHKAVVEYDPETRLFRGAFTGLNGGADFYAASVDDLEAEGRTSLEVFLETCREADIEPYRSYSGRFNVRLDPALHETAALSAAAERMSLNDWVSAAIAKAASEQ